MIDRVGRKPLVTLRRADWRFLLPGPPAQEFQHLVLLGGSPELAERLIEVGLTRRVSCSLPMERLADAVVVLHDAPATAFNRAIDCLLPGGVFYCEVNRRQPDSLTRTPGRVYRSLLAKELTPTGLYWTMPDFDHCKRYLPMDVPGAFDWYLETLFVSGTPWHRLLEIGLRLGLGRNSRRFAAFAPCFSVTAIAGTAENLAPSVLAHPALPLQLQNPKLRPLLLTSGQDDGSRVIVLPFAPGAPQPIAVLKVARLANFNTNTAREQVMMAELRSRLSPSLRRTIPQPLGTFCYSRLRVGVESYAAGRSLLVSGLQWPARLERRTEELRLAATWLGDFHQQAQISRLQWNDVEVGRWIERPLAVYTRAFGTTVAEEHLFAAVRRQARALVGASLPIVWQHNDFGPWNIHRAGQALTVIDWEFSDRQQDRFGPVLCDLLYFVTHWSYLARRLSGETAELRGFRELFCGPSVDEVVTAARVVIAEYITRLDLDRRFLPLLLVYTWIQRALDRYERQKTLGELDENSRSGNRYVQYVSLLAQHIEDFLEAL